jgi:hypothetical protein
VTARAVALAALAPTLTWTPTEPPPHSSRSPSGSTISGFDTLYLIRFRPLKIPPPPHKQPRCLSRPALAPSGVLKLRIGFLCLQSARAPRLDVDDARFRERSLPCTPPLCPRNRGAPPERRRGSQLSRSSGFQVLQRCDVVVLRSVRGGMLVFMLPPHRWPARSARGSLLAVHRMPVMLFLPVSRVLCLR